MYSVEEVKELLKAFDSSKATKLVLKGEDGEVLTIAQQLHRALQKSSLLHRLSTKRKSRRTRAHRSHHLWSASSMLLRHRIRSLM